jgi:hypothetical protein
MKTSKTPRLLSLLGALLCLAPVGASAATPPVESFVSPGHLFPSEGTTFLHPNGEGNGTYRPLSAHDKPGGRVIGEVVLRNPHCVTTQPPVGCEDGLVWALNLKSGRSLVLETAEYSYGTDSLIAYGPSLDAPNGAAWSPITAAKSTFWVSTPKVDVHRFEELASFVEEPEQWCTVPGKCAPLSAEMKSELKRVQSGQVVLLTCYLGYNISGIVTREGARYYRLERPELDASSPPTSLPKVGFTPVRKSDGSHTGTFSPRGC